MEQCADGVIDTVAKRSNVDLDLSLAAKAELRAEIKTEIPSASSGRMLDALTDILRPFSERRGLKADLLRLQREEVLLKIALQARDRLEVEKAPIRSIPNKFLVPLLEKASLEDPDDEIMITMWSHLLAGAAMADTSRKNRFVSILEELNGQQAKLLQDIITDGYEPGKLKLGHIHDAMFVVSQSGIHDEINRLKDFETADALEDALLELLDIAGTAIDVVIVHDIEYDDIYDFRPVDTFYIDDRQIDFEILESLFLIKRIEVRSLVKKNKDDKEKFSIDAFYYATTYLGLQLFAACNLGWFLQEETN